MRPQHRSSQTRQRFSIPILALAFSVSLSAALLAQARYTVTEIVLPGGSNSHADGIDDLGRVVGGSEYDSNSEPRACSDYLAPEGITGHREHAFLWVNGTISDLNPFTGAKSAADGINSAGHVVGRSTTLSNPGVVHGFFWRSAHQYTDLGALPGGTNSNANSINSQDLVVGGSSSSDAPDGARPYVWQGAHMVEISSNSSPDTEAVAVNSSGSIAGFGDQGLGYPQPMLWHRRGEDPQLLPGLSPDLPLGLALGINSSGQVAGVTFPTFPCNFTDFCSNAVVWTGGVASSLGTLTPATSSFANAINDAGTVVGFATVLGDDGDQEERAIVWDPTNGMRDLNLLIGSLPWKLKRANAVNNLGQIAGCGRKNGRMRAFLLTPQ